MRKEIFANGEHYHICNRGVEKRNITNNPDDSERFIKSLIMFNTIEPIGSIYEQSLVKNENKKKGKPLVKIIAYCLNPNHFHLILEQLTEKGVSIFLGRVCGGYAYYFNKKYKRTGTLFQGKFKARHIADNDDLLHASAYVNLNNKVHQLGVSDSKLIRNSWDEYLSSSKKGLCYKKIILDQFTGAKDYRKFALASLELMLERKQEQRELKSFELSDI